MGDFVMEANSQNSNEGGSALADSVDRSNISLQEILAFSAFLASPLVDWKPRSEKAVTVLLAIVVILVSSGMVGFGVNLDYKIGPISIDIDKFITILAIYVVLLYYYLQLLIAYYRAYSQWKLRAAVFAASIIPLHAAAGAALQRHRELLASLANKKVASVQEGIEKLGRSPARRALLEEIHIAIRNRLNETAPDAGPNTSPTSTQESVLPDGLTLRRPVLQHRRLTPIPEIVLQDAKPKLFGSDDFSETEKKSILLAFLKAPHDEHGLSSLFIDLLKEYTMPDTDNKYNTNHSDDTPDRMQNTPYAIELEILFKAIMPAQILFRTSVIWDLLLPSGFFIVATAYFITSYYF